MLVFVEGGNRMTVLSFIISDGRVGVIVFGICRSCFGVGFYGVLCGLGCLVLGLGLVCVVVFVVRCFLFWFGFFRWLFVLSCQVGLGCGVWGFVGLCFCLVISRCFSVCCCSGCWYRLASVFGSWLARFCIGCAFVFLSSWGC